MSSVTPSTRPSAVTWSFVIWVIGAILGLITGILVFIAAAIGGTVAAVSGAGLIAGLAIAAGIGYLVIAILELIVVVMMRNGRNWARILLTIFAALQVIGTLTQGGNNSAWSWVTFALVVIAAVLMYLPSSNAYFSKTPRVDQNPVAG